MAEREAVASVGGRRGGPKGYISVVRERKPCKSRAYLFNTLFLGHTLHPSKNAKVRIVYALG